MQFTYDDAILNVEVYGPKGLINQPGTPYAVDFTKIPILVLHGNQGSIKEFKELIKHFAPHRSVIGIDSRGQGKSLVSPHMEISYEIMARDVREVLDRIGIPEVHLVGFSDGAITSFLLAQDKFLRVKTLTAIGGNLNPQGLSDETLDDIKQELKKRHIKHSFDIEDYPDMEFGAESEKALLELVANEPHIKPKTLRKITAPTLIISGEHDMVLNEHSELIKREIHDARHVVIEGANHFVMQSHPEQINTLIEELIEAHDYILKPIEAASYDHLDIRLAHLDDQKALYELYNELIDTLDEGSYSGWKRGVYPTLDIVDRGIAEQNLYVAFDKESGELLASMSLRYDVPHHFAAAGWESLEQDEAIMIHTLIVSPKSTSKGVARAMLAFTEDVANADPRCKAIRLNTSGQNMPANYLYTRMGYKRYYSFLQPYRGLDISDWTNSYEKRIRF